MSVEELHQLNEQLLLQIQSEFDLQTQSLPKIRKMWQFSFLRWTTPFNLNAYCMEEWLDISNKKCKKKFLCDIPYFLCKIWYVTTKNNVVDIYSSCQGTEPVCTEPANSLSSANTYLLAYLFVCLLTFTCHYLLSHFIIFFTWFNFTFHCHFFSFFKMFL